MLLCVLASNEVDRKMVIFPKTDFHLDKPESTESPQC